MSKFSIRTYRDFEIGGLRVQLRCDNRFVEDVITDEQMVDAYSPHVLMKTSLEKLAETWTKEFGGAGLRVWPPAAENEPWVVAPDDVIDGEIVEERRAIDAPRKAITGR